MTAAVLEDPNWTADALQLLARVAESGEDFDAYALERDHGLRPPPSPAMWGRLFRTAYAAQIITPPWVSISQNAADDQAACVASGADSPATPTGRPQHERA